MRLKEYESAVLLFAKDPNVAFTNNRAERDLRISKVKQKVSGCFRAELYAKVYCRISSYLQTMANKGVNPLIAIQMAFAGKFDSLREHPVRKIFQMDPHVHAEKAQYSFHIMSAAFTRDDRGRGMSSY